MKNIADLLLRVWPRSQPASNTQAAVMAENRDRSSMADFVRILQAYDQDQYGRSNCGVPNYATSRKTRLHAERRS
jgi:hypothetical protein